MNDQLLSREEKLRLRYIEHFQKFRSVTYTARHFGVSPNTIYLWYQRYIKDGISGLRDLKKTRRPRLLRQPTWPPNAEKLVRAILASCPTFGRAKIYRILQQKKYSFSQATVGRMVSKLKKTRKNLA